ncbi:MAG: NTP transferase domain-containing protein [Acidobacteriota bacterium]
MTLRPLVGVALAGGQSRRLGRDKAMLPASSHQSFAERAVSLLQEVAEIVVVADGGRQRVAGVPSLRDAPGAAGPAAGLLAAAQAYPGQPLLVLACDLPAVSPELLRELAHREVAADLFLPRWHSREGRERLEPLCARWSPKVLAELANRVRDGAMALHPLARTGQLHGDSSKASGSGLLVSYLEAGALAVLGSPEQLFLNVNRESDWRRWRRGQGT